MAALMEEALETYLAVLEEWRGAPFERRGGAPRTRRPVKARRSVRRLPPPEISFARSTLMVVPCSADGPCSIQA
jgi:hypothetical protein